MNQMESKKITKCPQGHWYSGAIYDSCPYCGGGTAAVSNGMAQSNQGQVTVPVDETKPIQNLSTVSANPPEERGKTVSVFDNGTAGTAGSAGNVGNVGQTPASDENKTIGMWATNSVTGKEPVTGWLVSVEGKHKGEDFRLKVGKNFVGRDRSMDVCLSKDNTVSRNRHCIIVYEPKSRIFIVQAGDSRELTYLNDEILLEPKKLVAGDKITVGSSTLMFVPLCGENFTWNFD